MKLIDPPRKRLLYTKTLLNIIATSMPILQFLFKVEPNRNEPLIEIASRLSLWDR